MKRHASSNLLTLRAPFILAAVLAAALAGCRGTTSEQPPIHLNPNMDTQNKYKAQRESMFFTDGADMRTPVEHTVARGELREDDVFYRGKDADGTYADNPLAVDEALLARGTDRFNVFCSVCHGEHGDGRGKIMEYKYPIPPTSYYDPRIMEAKDGYLFEVITNGVRSMPSYRQQIPVRDRWAIVAHVRELQKLPPPPPPADTTQTMQAN
jgi:mono/diheme cytochrome c family protein